jgi:hypothetical protein
MDVCACSGDVSTPFIYGSNPYNVRPPLYQLRNSTASTALLTWPVYNNRSDAIGTTLFINDIEIYHSTYTDTSYGGGSTPFNDSRPSAARSTMMLSPLHQSDTIAQSLDPSSTAEMSALHAAIVAYHPSLASVYLQLPTVISRLPLPYHAPSRVGRSRTAAVRTPRMTDGDIDPQRRPAAWRTFSTTRLESSGSTARTPGDASPSQRSSALLAPSSPATTLSVLDLVGPPLSDLVSNVTRFFYVFQLVNLLPNTSYVATAGYLLPNGVYNFGKSIIINTNDVPP